MILPGILGLTLLFAGLALLYMLRLWEVRVHSRNCGGTAGWAGAFVQEYLATLFILVTAWFPALSRADPKPRTPARPAKPKPVALIPSWPWTAGSMTVLAHRLQARGFAVRPVSYPRRGSSIDAMVEAVERELERISEAFGGASVDVVAHGLGGLLIRALLVNRCGKPCVAGNVVTLGAPHQGAPLASLFRHPYTVPLRPGSRFLARLATAEAEAGSSREERFAAMRGSRHVTSIRSTFDEVVFPPDTAYMDWAFNVQVEGLGHHTLLWSGRVAALVAENLSFAASEEDPAPDSTTDGTRGSDVPQGPSADASRREDVAAAATSRSGE